MKTRNGPLPVLVGSTLAVAVLATVVVENGWLFWIPVSLALAVIGSFIIGPSRR